MTVLAYLRVSGKGQIVGDGFPRQRAAIEAYAAAHAMTVRYWFSEEGVSGTTDFDARPAWVDMVAALRPGESIIIERLDRLARDLGVQEFILRDLKKRAIPIYSTAEADLGSADPTRILFRQIIGAVASYERSMIEAKLRHARDRKRKKDGRCEGRKPFGAREGEADTLHVMTRMKEAGEPYRRIAEWLNRNAHHATRTGKPWSHATVAKILSARATPPLSGAMLPGPVIARPCVASDPEVHSCPGFS